ncbi:aspartyl-phosphate phosphatase Spo0E family protein [Paenibacillus sp. IHBB 10380]|jgi:hypothetical protein|uniref:aspartyl-phosphate phosphatase Spo0E family protein n=1 Tax=Paenibacillus sp. IHBB 10380 TaxID=1566358 RepID=UPI0005CFA2E8|nr:aspartyl-phosphate phosphatase Spo0E family protein [Paenibacillus sp. IHBB 10380]AJS59671.1 sporulation protein Spo0E [Paenibacillus sp. IHBB 10380]
MLCTDYDLPTYLGSYAAEGNRNKWSTHATDSSLRDNVLEDEIQVLRSKMEQTFTQEKSFTSDIVIEISIMLDQKINEYMRICGAKK